MPLISRVGMRGFRGQTRAVDLEKQCVLLQGPVGAGKTSILLAILMVAGLPTPLGAKNLAAFSPTGQWEIEADVKGQTFTWRYDQKAGSAYLNGPIGRVVPCKADRFAINLKRDLDLEPHHVDLGAFAELSGPKRAQLFAAILSGEPVSIEDAVKSSTDETLGALAERVAGTDAAEAVWPTIPPSLPGPLCDQVNSWLVGIQGQRRTAANEVGSAQRAEVAAPADPAALRAKVAEINQKMGKLTSDIEASESIARAYEAAETLCKNKESGIAVLRANLEAARRTNGELPALKSKLAELESKAAAGIAPRDAATLEGVNTRVADTLCALKHDEIQKLAPKDEYKSDVFVAGFDTCLGKVRDLVAEMITQEEDRKAAASQRVIDDTKRSVEASERVVATIPERERTLKEAEDQLVAMREQKQRMQVPADVSLLKTEKEALEVDRREVNASIAAAEQQQAAVARMQTAREQLAKLEVQEKIGRALYEAVCSYRDAQTSIRVAQVTAPMGVKLTALFGRDVNVEFRIVGEGRAQQVDILVNLKDSPVRFQDLSAGESILVAAAFLSTLQGLKGTPGTMLLLEGNALDGPSMQTFLEKAPELGMDLLMVATNNTNIVAGEQWQTVSL